VLQKITVCSNFTTQQCYSTAFSQYFVQNSHRGTMAICSSSAMQ